MVTTQTKKRALAFRASNEIYEKVKALTEGEEPAFESTSEYLYSLVVADLARRDLGVDYITQKFLELLENSEIRELVRKKLK
ncbi:MAG: hypothetical protein PHF33_10980 [Candidatus Delongbacteria bacterium]|nr:hypothetical protein [Candidatus Delongbacteria bacterium]